MLNGELNDITKVNGERTVEHIAQVQYRCPNPDCEIVFGRKGLYKNKEIIKVIGGKLTVK